MTDTLRTATINRNTTETQIALTLLIDGQGAYTVSTGIRFFDHMLELFTRHGGFDLTLKVTGDLDVDQHHTVEDTGIALGEAFAQALGDKKGILRAGYFVMPMDETLAVAAVDLSGRTRLRRRRPGHRPARRRLPDRTSHRLHGRLRPRSQVQRPREDHVWP